MLNCNNLQDSRKEKKLPIKEVFSLLRENVRKQVEVLEKARIDRKLTDEEDEIIQRFREELDRTEKSISKKIDDIKDETR